MVLLYVHYTYDWILTCTYLTLANPGVTGGYFMAGDTKWAEENITCVGILGGWLPGHLFNCIRVEVCDGEVPPAHDLMNSTSDEDFRFLDGSLTYTCPPGMATTEGHVNQTVICYENPDGDGYSFQPFQVDPCNVCQEEPSVGNATTSWNDTQVWMVNDTLSVACIPHHLLDGEPDGELLCTPLGWEERYCYEGCTEAPPTPGANMTQGEGDYSVGSILQYTCDSGYFVPPLQVNFSFVSWERWLAAWSRCPVGWIITGRTWGPWSAIVVNMSCPASHVFPDLNDTVTITCEEDEEWTPVYASFLICRQLCPWSKSSEIPVNATILHDPTPYWLESEILYWRAKRIRLPSRCRETPPGTAPPDSWEPRLTLVTSSFFLLKVNLTCPMNHTFGDFNTSLSLTCEKDGYWTYVDPDILLCRIECPEEPPSAPANSTLEDAVPPYWVTSNVTYECEEGLGLPWGGTVTVLTCEEDGWTAFPTGLKCLAACSPPPQPRGLGKYNHTGPTLWGTVVEYTCPYGFDVEEKDEEDEGPMLLSTTCEDGSWSLTDIPNCYGK
ncbi:hypothetical protein O3P69_001122 [Scylla paramamosain]|uniref:Sushi domain-containing protein n=1 Tax=Scylla paramamosain TaxID=85552 RepID=A0AAW0URZ9_SCYPA